MTKIIKKTRLDIRLSPGDRETLKRKAHNRGVSVSEYIRMLIHEEDPASLRDGRSTEEEHTAALESLGIQIKRIGNNINQLQRVINSGSYVQGTLKAYQQAAETLEQIIKEHYHDYYDG